MTWNSYVRCVLWLLSLFSGLSFLFFDVLFSMKILVWNCQGAASKGFHRAAKTFIMKCRTTVFALLETKISGEGTSRIYNQFGYDNWTSIEAVGFSGGIWTFWKEDIGVELKLSHPQFMLLDITDGKMRRWSIVVVYASPNQSLRMKLWSSLHADTMRIDTPWIAI